MPIYAYQCNTCELKFEKNRPMKDSRKVTFCECGGLCSRDIRAEQCSVPMDWNKQQISLSAGVSRRQVDSMNRKFADIDGVYWREDGRRVADNERAAHAANMRQGLHDMDGVRSADPI